MEPETSLPARGVHCCACSRLIPLPPLAGSGFALSCPLCGTAQVLREHTVLVAEPAPPPA